MVVQRLSLAPDSGLLLPDNEPQSPKQSTLCHPACPGVPWEQSSPATKAGCPIQARFWLEWDTTALDVPFFVIRSVARGSAEQILHFAEQTTRGGLVLDVHAFAQLAKEIALRLIEPLRRLHHNLHYQVSPAVLVEMRHTLAA
jgi:hypothetical protein